MLGRILNRLSLSENKRRYLNLKGIISGRYAYKGPDVVQIDLTDKCDCGCTACWLHSPFLNKPPHGDFPELEYGAVINLIDELKRRGTKELIFSGGGEPFMHPRIWQVLEYAQGANLRFRLNTNLALLDEKDILRLTSFRKLVSVTASVWSGRQDLYAFLHNRPAQQFLRVKQNLRALNAARKKGMEVKLYAVISNLNYFDLKAIAAMAQETGCTGIEFGVIDAVAGATDRLLLNEDQLDILKNGFLKLVNRMKNKKVRIVNKGLFLRRISSPGAARGEYDGAVSKTPCYAGWFFLRVRANGSVNSCLKSHRFPVGNIYKESFGAIWNGRKQQFFRMSGICLPRDKRLFSLMGNSAGSLGCSALCDNTVINEHVHNRLRYTFAAKNLMLYGKERHWPLQVFRLRETLGLHFFKGRRPR
ncbi:MAG: radical SAM protein [Candidatus Omnitrophota bacterium]